jgi:hypothetical protein
VCVVFAAALGAACGARSSLRGELDARGTAGSSGAANGAGGSSGSAGIGAGGAGGGAVPPTCHLVLASPAAIPLIAFPEGDADTPLLAVIDPGDAADPSGPRPARVAAQAISQDANFWHPELRIAGLRIDVPWPDGATIEQAPVLAGIDAHAWGRIATAPDGGVGVLWYRGDEAAGKPAGLKFRLFDTTRWSGGPEVWVDPEGESAHALRPGKLDGTPGGPDGYVAAWRQSPAFGPETRVAVLDPSGAIAMGPFATANTSDLAWRVTDAIWTGEAHLVAVPTMACTDDGPPCNPDSMNILRVVPPSGGDAGGVELVSSIPLVSPGAEPRRPVFGRTATALWLAWSEKDPGDETAPRRMRLVRLDAAGNIAAEAETVAEGVVPAAALSVASSEHDLLLAWGEVANPDLGTGTTGHSRLVVHHRDGEGSPLDSPISIETTGFANNPSITMVAVDHPWSVIVSWASMEEGTGARSITYLSRLDCTAAP